MTTTSITSLVASRIALLFGTEELAGGTAFFYEHLGEVYLVTNWHNVTGRDPSTRKPKHTQAAVPDALSISIPTQNSDAFVKFFDIEFELYRDEDRQIPVWWEHPVHAQDVDLAVIPMGYSLKDVRFKDYRVVTVNQPEVSSMDVPIHPGQDVFTLGFPRMMDGNGFAIWKRGSIATEPSFDLAGLPKIFIDSATREGMSGAPVFVSGLVSVRIPGRQMSGLGVRNRFLGIYSGRVGDDTFLAQLGVVWKESAIVETITVKKVGQTSF